MKTTTITIVGVAVIAAILTILPNFVSNNGGAKVSAAPLVATESFYDFGEIPLRGGLVETQFELTNEGTDPITIGKVYTSCMCTTATIIESDGNEKGKFGMPGHKGQLAVADSIVPPGESITVNAIYDPAAHGPSGVGLAQRSIYLETDSSETPKVELRIKAMVNN